MLTTKRTVPRSWTLTITTAIPMPTAPMMWNLLWKTSLMASGQGLGRQTKTLVMHGACSGHTSFLPQHPFHTQSTSGPRERGGNRSAHVSWLVDGKENQERYRRWVPNNWVRNHRRKIGKSLLWVCFLSGLHVIILKFGH